MKARSNRLSGRFYSGGFAVPLGVVLPTLVTTLIVALLLTGCSSVSGLVTRLTPNGGPVALKKLSLKADRLLNSGAPVAVDLVLVFEQKPLVMLGALRAGEWFSNRQDLVRQYPNQLLVTSWEIVPGQVIESMSLAEGQEKLVGVLVFADYPGGQSYRADATGMPNVRVNLLKDDFSIFPF